MLTEAGMTEFSDISCYTMSLDNTKKLYKNKNHFKELFYSCVKSYTSKLY